MFRQATAAASAIAAVLLIATPAPGAPVADSVASEPMFAEIVSRASILRDRVAAYVAAPDAPLPGFASFSADINRLSDLNANGSAELRARGNDDDLKCILDGIAVDLKFRLGEVEAATTADQREDALKEMSYLLRDNVEVITTPPPEL